MSRIERAAGGCLGGPRGGARRRWRVAIQRALALPAVFLSATLPAQDPPSWRWPTEPFRIVGPIQYVGTQGLAAYLITTRAGAILIDGTMEQNAPVIRRNIERLGVPIGQVKLLLLTHAHFDHAAGLAALKRTSGGRLVVGAGDARRCAPASRRARSATA